MQLPWWGLLGAIILSFVAGAFITSYVIAYYLHRTGLLDDMEALTKARKERHNLFDQLQRNQIFINSLPVKDQRAKNLLMANQNLLKQIADEEAHQQN